MRLSQTPIEALETLPDAALARIVFGDYRGDDLYYDVALLLGGPAAQCRIRSAAAAELYHAGRTRYILATGGMPVPLYGQTLTETEQMTRHLLKAGVPRSVILQEGEARDTHENMIYGVLQIRRQLRFRNVARVCVVTSHDHLRRSMELARFYLPKTVEVSGYAANRPETTPENWASNPTGRGRVLQEAKLLHRLVETRNIPDILY
jgi:uncharacterized SAM-binding protein YcdF (DUF218 family)